MLVTSRECEHELQGTARALFPPLPAWLDAKDSEEEPTSRSPVESPRLDNDVGYLTDFSDDSYCSASSANFSTDVSSTRKTEAEFGR